MENLTEVNGVKVTPEVASFVKAVADVMGLGKEKEGVSKAEQIKLLKALAVEGPEGEKARKDFGASRADFVLPLLPAQSTVRSIFTVEELAPGATPSYPISFEDVRWAYIAPTLSGPAAIVLQGDEIFVPQLKMQGYVEFPSQFAADARYNIVQKATNALKNSMIQKEEVVGWRVAKATISGVRSDQTVWTGGIGSAGNLFPAFSISGMNLLYTRMQQMGRELTDVFMTPLRYADVRNFQTAQIDYATQREIIQNAGLPGATLFGATIHTVYNTNLINDGEAFGFDKRSFCVMPITRQLITRDDPMAFTRDAIGTHAFTTMGFACMDPWAISRIRFDAVV